MLGLALLVAGWAVISPAHATVLPAGFVETQFIFVIEPTSFDFAPNGDLVIGTLDGNVYIARAGNLIKAGTLPVPGNDELGITGLELDPDFAVNHQVWIYYTTPAPWRQRLSRFSLAGDTLAAETVMIEYPVVNTFHHAGCLRFDTDGTLFVSTGDDGLFSTTAQNPFDLRGKILHVNRDGTPAAGNPFPDGLAGDPRIWAMGLRHPWRFNLQPGTRTLFIADVGAGAWEELDLGLAGANYGWAAVEGPQPPGQPGFVYPIYWYPHTSPLGNSIIGGDHAQAGDFSPDYLGNYFFADEAARELHRMVLDASNNVVQAGVFATDVTSPVDIKFGPDGALYYASWAGFSIQRIAYVGGTNRAPVAVATAIPASGLAPLLVSLDGTASSDPDNDPLTFSWDSGDGATSTSATLVHSYPAGVYAARLTVSDGQGGVTTSPDLRIVSGNRAPVPSITAPIAGTRYNAGDTISYAGTGSDPEDGTLGCAALSWTVIFHHAGHTHPHHGPIEGTCAGSFTIPQTGETSSDTWYEIRLTVTDSGAPLGSVAALAATASVAVLPNTVQLRLESAPRSDLTLTLDDTLLTAPVTTGSVVDFFRGIGAPSPQTGADGRTYTFASWSDGGAAMHAILTPAVDTTYTAAFNCNVLTEVPGLMVAPAAGGQITLTWSAPADLCLATGAPRYRVYASATAFPSVPPGQFPLDPLFALRGTATSETLTFLPSPADQFFLVVAIGSDGGEGPAGHYGR
jgi:glucose/arabinose dehydrogenase